MAMQTEHGSWIASSLTSGVSCGPHPERIPDTRRFVQAAQTAHVSLVVAERPFGLTIWDRRTSPRHTAGHRSLRRSRRRSECSWRTAPRPGAGGCSVVLVPGHRPLRRERRSRRHDRRSLAGDAARNCPGHRGRGRRATGALLPLPWARARGLSVVHPSVLSSAAGNRSRVCLGSDSGSILVQRAGGVGHRRRIPARPLPRRRVLRGGQPLRRAGRRGAN